MKSSLSKNAILNTLKTIIGIIFPLITFPYVSRILGVENIGKINFSSSIVSYFTIVAAFGVPTYAIREGTKIRDNKRQLFEFSNQVFTINLITTLLAYFLLVMLIIISSKTRKYSVLIIILSTSMLFDTVGADWLNTIYEDFKYITIRTLAFQIISLFLMFIFVRDSDDLYFYAAITVLSSAGNSICNYFYCRKYAKLHIVRLFNVKKYLIPMSMFLMSNITTIIFLNSDQTMLGLICGDYNVGIYSISVKIYTIIKNIFTAVLTVMMPRFSYLQSKENSRNNVLLRTQTLNIFALIVIPMAVGLFCISEDIIALIGGNAYAEASSSLRILSISVICSAAASFLTYIIIIPEGKEKVMLIASTLSATINVLLNFCLIPIFRQNGAALTTAIAEFVVFVVECKAANIKLENSSVFINMFTIIIASSMIFFCSFIVRSFIENTVIAIIVIIISSVITYFFVLYILKNEYVLIEIKKIKCKLPCLVRRYHK